MDAKKLFDRQLVKAINKYGDDHVDIMITEENEVYGFYHSNCDSSPITDTFSLDELGGMQELMKYEEEFEHLCICEEE